jgi:hypothetical protein
MYTYLTYDEYLDMGGLLGQAAFARWGAQAALFIDRATQSRLRGMDGIPDEVKGLMFELVALASSADPAGRTRTVTQESESADGVSSSRTYSQGGGHTDGAMERFAAAYLTGVTDGAGTPLLYLGVRP